MPFSFSSHGYFWYFLPVNIENQKDGLIIKEVYEQLEKRFLKMPNHYTVKGCNDFEKYVAENFDKSIIPNLQHYLGRL